MQPYQSTQSQELFAHSARGVYIQRQHHRFLSTAHTKDTIQQTLGVADAAYQMVKQRLA